VLLNGSGFDAPGWTLRVSLANLTDDVYKQIGEGVRAVARSIPRGVGSQQARIEGLAVSNGTALTGVPRDRSAAFGESGTTAIPRAWSPDADECAQLTWSATAPRAEPKEARPLAFSIRTRHTGCPSFVYVTITSSVRSSTSGVKPSNSDCFHSSSNAFAASRALRALEDDARDAHLVFPRRAAETCHHADLVARGSAIGCVGTASAIPGRRRPAPMARCE
jgi:hypothetical protein